MAQKLSTDYYGLTALEDFRQVELAKVVHIISTPYDNVNPIAGAKAQATKNFHDNLGDVQSNQWLVCCS